MRRLGTALFTITGLALLGGLLYPPALTAGAAYLGEVAASLGAAVRGWFDAPADWAAVGAWLWAIAVFIPSLMLAIFNAERAESKGQWVRRALAGGLCTVAWSLLLAFLELGFGRVTLFLLATQTGAVLLGSYLLLGQQLQFFPVVRNANTGPEGERLLAQQQIDMFAQKARCPEAVHNTGTALPVPAELAPDPLPIERLLSPSARRTLAAVSKRICGAPVRSDGPSLLGKAVLDDAPAGRLLPRSLTAVRRSRVLSDLHEVAVRATTIMEVDQLIEFTWRALLRDLRTELRSASPADVLCAVLDDYRVVFTAYGRAASGLTRPVSLGADLSASVVCLWSATESLTEMLLACANADQEGVAGEIDRYAAAFCAQYAYFADRARTAGGYRAALVQPGARLTQVALRAAARIHPARAVTPVSHPEQTQQVSQ